jgi:hypothetical protein
VFVAPVEQTNKMGIEINGGKKRQNLWYNHKNLAMKMNI